MQEELGLTYIFISHNLAVVKCIVKRTAVMYLGRIMELGNSEDIMMNPVHPYTQELINAVSAIGKNLVRNLSEQNETSQSTVDRIGCLYRWRCKKATEKCAEQTPVLTEYTQGHYVACWEAKNE